MKKVRVTTTSGSDIRENNYATSVTINLPRQLRNLKKKFYFNVNFVFPSWLTRAKAKIYKSFCDADLVIGCLRKLLCSDCN